MTATLLLVRHGAIDWSGLVGAATDGLSELGRRQAYALARRLARYGVEAIYSSDLRRAAETAQAIAEALGLSVRLEPALREHALGAWEGQAPKELRERYPQEWSRLEGGDPDYAPSGGETLRQLQRRAVDVFARLLRRHQGRTVLAVSHGGLIAAYLCHVLGLPFQGGVPLLIDNASLTVLEEGQNGTVLAQFNNVGHLGGLPGVGEA